jgi:CheY-like chemotaxis protein
LLTAVVIDDDKNTANVCAEYLELVGVKVISVGYDGKDAVELYKKYRPDVLFSDLNMPRYDGIYALEKIQNLDPNAKIVIITANTDPKIFEKLYRFKPTEVFAKPFDMKKMTALLERIAQTKDTGIAGNEKKALVSFVITEALLKIGPSTNDEVGNRLYAKYHCYFSDCLEHPEYLKDILQEIFGNGSTAVIKIIREELVKFEDQYIRNFLFVMSK